MFHQLGGNQNGAASGDLDAGAGGQSAGEARTVLGPGCRVEGRLICSGPSRLAGEVEGELVADGYLLIDSEAKVAADLNVDELIVRGSFKGDVKATRRVALEQNAVVEGNIKTPSISISDGAEFRGRVDVSAEAASGPAQESAEIRKFAQPAE